MSDTMQFAPDYDAPLEYMRRTREYYLALGYDNPYRWAHYVDAPFTPPTKKLADSTLALITTAAPYQPDKGDQGPGRRLQRRRQVLHGVFGRQRGRPRHAHQPHRLRPQAHHGDRSEYLVPAAADARFAAEGRFRLAKRFHGAPTNRSQRVTLETDAPEILARCRQDQVDAALLVPT